MKRSEAVHEEVQVSLPGSRISQSELEFKKLSLALGRKYPATLKS
jgi:hypothetical protein